MLTGLMSAVTQTLQKSLDKNKDSTTLVQNSNQLELSSTTSSQASNHLLLDNRVSNIAVSTTSSDESMKTGTTASTSSLSTPDSSFEKKGGEGESFESEPDSEFVYESSCRTEVKETKQIIKLK